MAQRDYSEPIIWQLPMRGECQQRVDKWLDDYDDQLVIEALSEEAQVSRVQ